MGTPTRMFPSQTLVRNRKAPSKRLGKRSQRYRLACLIVFAGTWTGCAGLSPLDYPVSSGIGVSHVGQVGTPMTLPRFIGLDVLVHRTALLARHTREKAAAFVPALEPHALAIPLSHPDNANSPSPAVANVHKLKKAKAESQVKVKAVAALASFDCASNPHVEEGLLAALHDASTEVREAAVEAVWKSTRSCCNQCGGCCSELIRMRLTEMVFLQDEQGCWLEPNSRTRRLARLALDACGGPLDPQTCQCQSDSLPLEYPAIQIFPSEN